MKHRFYVYRITNGTETVYVGKGSGDRLKNQMRKFKLPGEVLEWCASDAEAFQFEVAWITRLSPTANKCAGGNGNTAAKPIEVSPERYADISDYYRTTIPQIAEHGRAYLRELHNAEDDTHLMTILTHKCAFGLLVE
jgi:hypothetical protein